MSDRQLGIFLLCAAAVTAVAIWYETRPTADYIAAQYSKAAKICETDVDAGGEMIADLDGRFGTEYRPDRISREIVTCGLDYISNLYRDLDEKIDGAKIASEKEEPRIPISQMPQ